MVHKGLFRAWKCSPPELVFPRSRRVLIAACPSHACSSSSFRASSTWRQNTFKRRLCGASSPCTAIGFSNSVGKSMSTSSEKLACPPDEQRQNAQQRWTTVGNVGYFALATGFVMTDVLVLRTMLVGGYVCVTTFHAVQDRPLLIPLWWSALFASINAVMASLLFKDRFLALSDEEHEIYRQHFEVAMTQQDFKKLVKHGKILIATERCHVIQAGEVSDLVLILEGESEICRAGGFNVKSSDPGWIGTTSFLMETPTRKEVFVAAGCRYIMWDATGLKDLMRKEPTLRQALQTIIGFELARKLKSTTYSLMAASESANNLVRHEYEAEVLRCAMRVLFDRTLSKKGEIFLHQLEQHRQAHGIPVDIHASVMAKLGIDEMDLMNRSASLEDVFKSLTQSPARLQGALRKNSTGGQLIKKC